MSTLERIENLKDTECIVDMLLKEVRANPCQACGKCVFGYEGITQLELTLSDITEKKGRSGDLDLIKDLCQVMKTQSLLSGPILRTSRSTSAKKPAKQESAKNS